MSARRRCAGLVFLVSLALCISWTLSATATAAAVTTARAQSGRRQTPPASPVATPTPDDKATQGESESESKPRGASSSSRQAGATLVDFIIMEDDNALIDIPYGVKDFVVETFLQRLRQSSSVSVQGATKGSMNDARKRAKDEKAAFVVFFQLQEEGADMGRGSVGQADTQTLIIKTYVFAPTTGKVKFGDRVVQRPYRQTATIGGVRVPVPASRPQQFPSQNELGQAAQEAADRLMSRFNVILPPEN